MNYDYSKRGYLLPHGCKDLVDTLGQEGGENFVIRVHLPAVSTATLMITVEGRSIRILGTQKGGETVFEVPVGYDIAKARANYLMDELQIVIPKAAA